MQPIAVLDFETANHQPNSACQLGVAIVEPWQVVRQKKWMIRPRRLYFSPRCIAVHGITPNDVKDAPTWEEIWTEVLEWIDGSVLVAHNAGFDANVLVATCMLYELAVPPLDVLCTRLIAKRSWPSLRSHSLASMAEHLSIEFQHHDALEDAKVSARLLIEAAMKCGADGIEQLEDRLGLVRGRIWSDRIRHPRTVRRSRIEAVAESPGRYEPKRYAKDGAPRKQAKSARPRRIADEILMHSQGSLPLEGKHLILVGTLLGLDRQDSVAFLGQLGAKVQSDINLQTQYIVQGTLNESDGSGGISEMIAGISARRRSDIESRSEQGQSLTILSQRQLLAMLPAGLETARGEER
jgi:DNA polymerase-3 subunit epsilon